MTKMAENASCQRANTLVGKAIAIDILRRHLQKKTQNGSWGLKLFWGNCTGYVLGLYNFPCVRWCASRLENMSRIELLAATWYIKFVLCMSKVCWPSFGPTARTDLQSFSLCRHLNVLSFFGGHQHLVLVHQLVDQGVLPHDLTPKTNIRNVILKKPFEQIRASNFTVKCF